MTYFFKYINKRRNMNNISLIKTNDETWASNLPCIKNFLIAHFKNLFVDKNLV